VSAPEGPRDTSGDVAIVASGEPGTIGFIAPVDDSSYEVESSSVRAIVNATNPQLAVEKVAFETGEYAASQTYVARHLASGEVTTWRVGFRLVAKATWVRP
jgi:hypothetical protein